jgi:hypothetical protein
VIVASDSRLLIDGAAAALTGWPPGVPDVSGG